MTTVLLAITIVCLTDKYSVYRITLNMSRILKDLGSIFLANLQRSRVIEAMRNPHTHLNPLELMRLYVLRGAIRRGKRNETSVVTRHIDGEVS